MFAHRRNITFGNLKQELGRLSERMESLRLPKGLLQAVLYIISELFSNVEEHSRAKRIVVNVVIEKKEGKIEVADNGIGLRKSYLNKKIYPKDDFSAIEFAVSGLSTKGSQERGFGLYSIKKLVEAFGGGLIIKTGLAEALFTKNKITLRKLSKENRGTSVEIKTPIKEVDFYKII